jgi:hypothetical protein
MAKNDPLEDPVEYDDEEYVDEEYDADEEYEESDGGGWRKWIILAAIGIFVVCLGLALVVWAARDAILTPVAAMFASQTPTATVTKNPTATFTVTPSPSETLAPTASETPKPTPMLLPPPEVMGIVDGPPVLNEQFDDNSHNWTGQGPSADYTIQQGMMVFKSSQPGQPAFVYCVTDCGPFADRYYYQAEMVDQRGADAAYGITFALDPQRNIFYLFAVKANTGQYALFKQVNNELVPVIDWTASPAVLPAPAPNVLGARFLTNKIDLFVNNTWVGEKEEKNNPYTSGRIGLYVQQDGVRLLTNSIKVFNLMDVTPEPPGTHPTAAQPVQPPAQATFVPPPETLQPGQPTAAQPANTPIPQPTLRFSPTPTQYGACPNNIPAGKWALVITKGGNANRQAEITINGVTSKIKDLTTVFYLDQGVNYNVKLGNKSFEFYFDNCQIVYKKVNS